VFVLPLQAALFLGQADFSPTHQTCDTCCKHHGQLCDTFRQSNSSCASLGRSETLPMVLNHFLVSSQKASKTQRIILRR